MPRFDLTSKDNRRVLHGRDGEHGPGVHTGGRMVGGRSVDHAMPQTNPTAPLASRLAGIRRLASSQTLSRPTGEPISLEPVSEPCRLEWRDFNNFTNYFPSQKRAVEPGRTSDP